MSDSNKDKSRHGASNNKALNELLVELKNEELLTNYEKDFRSGYSDYSMSQFRAPYMITLNNGENWLLFNTTSMRTDRIKGNQWDAFNLRQLIPDITFAAIVYPDSTSEKDLIAFEHQRNKYINQKEYSEIDDIISQSELLTLLEEKYMEDVETGRKLDLRGRKFERQIEFIISNSSNMLKWHDTNDSMRLVGVHYDIFKRIVGAFGLTPAEVIRIDATTDIPKLPSRGNPKADVLVMVTFVDGSTKNYTISCKKTTAKLVTVHEYDANAFSDVLDPANDELRALLNEFQKKPTLSDFGDDNAKRLSSLLLPHLERLSLWVLGGYGGLGIPNLQWADYIIVNDIKTSEVSIYSTPDYYNKLLSSGLEGHFGTVFSWTYPSKRRGKRIQLKCRVI